MTNIATIENAKAHLEEMIDGARRGEEWLIADPNGQPLVKLTWLTQESVSVGERWAAFGMMKGQIELGPDFDEPLEDFKPYME